MRNLEFFKKLRNVFFVWAFEVEIYLETIFGGNNFRLALFYSWFGKDEKNGEGGKY